MSLDSEDSREDDELPLELVYDLLSARRRRYVLYCLHLYANPVRLPHIAEQVVEWEHGAPWDELLDERLHAYNDLYHNHVPKLDEAGVVEYSQTEDSVELTARAARLRPYLDRAVEEDLETADVSSL